jgi:hypothetical protein
MKTFICPSYNFGELTSCLILYYLILSLFSTNYTVQSRCSQHAHTLTPWIHVRRPYPYEHLWMTEHRQILRFPKSPVMPRLKNPGKGAITMIWTLVGSVPLNRPLDYKPNHHQPFYFTNKPNTKRWEMIRWLGMWLCVATGYNKFLRFKTQSITK